MNTTSQTPTMQSGIDAKANAMAGKYLTFVLGREHYGIPVLKVREIVRLTPITTVAQMPPYVRGVINLRGRILPVIDLRLRFGFPESAGTEQTCVVIVETHAADSKPLHIGLVVDGVEEVITLSEAEIEDPPEFGSQIAADYLAGMAKTRDSVKALINIDRLLCE